MTIKEMRIEVCKKANKQIRQGMERVRAFKWAWVMVKKDADKTKATDLQTGDVVHLEFGDFGNFVKATILNIEKNLWGGLTLKIQYTDGRIFNCCTECDDMIKKVA